MDFSLFFLYFAYLSCKYEKLTKVYADPPSEVTLRIKDAQCAETNEESNIQLLLPKRLQEMRKKSSKLAEFTEKIRIDLNDNNFSNKCFFL